MGQLSCGPRTKMDALSLGVLRHRSTISLRCKNVTSSRMAGFMATSGEDVVVMIPDATTDSYVSKFDLTIKWLGGGGGFLAIRRAFKVCWFSQSNPNLLHQEHDPAYLHSDSLLQSSSVFQRLSIIFGLSLIPIVSRDHSP